MERRQAGRGYLSGGCGVGEVNLTPDIRDRLQKLIRLLSSDKEGEVLAAVSAMDRILEKAGLDFNTFADFLTEPDFDQARAKLIEGDKEGTVRLSDGRVVQKSDGPVYPETGRKKPPPTKRENLAWKNWCAQQRHENMLREQRTASPPKLPAPTAQPFRVDPLRLPKLGVKA